MTLTEKIERLCQLAKQKEAIDKELEALLGGDEKPAAVPRKTKKQSKPKQKPVRKTPVKKVPGKYDSVRYYCLDCNDTFVSEARKIDAVCPACGSVHVDYASSHNK